MPTATTIGATTVITIAALRLSLESLNRLRITQSTHRAVNRTGVLVRNPSPSSTPDASGATALGMRNAARYAPNPSVTATICDVYQTVGYAATKKCTVPNAKNTVSTNLL